MLMIIEHFSKWICLVVLPEKISELVATKFFNYIFVRFGAVTKVLTN